MSAIVVVGAATVDEILAVDHVPAEDEELRAAAWRTTVGGNAVNSALVLTQLGHRVELCAALGDDAQAALVRQTLAAAGVGTRFVPAGQAGPTPRSYVLLNRQTGSRTIVHHRGIAELGADALAAIDLGDADWLHLEARDVARERGWLAQVRRRWPALPVSLEIEKDRVEVDTLLALPDLIVVARRLASARGVGDAAALLGLLRAAGATGELVCAWGAEGAWLLGRAGAPAHAPPAPPPRVVDTLAAGDVFNAGLIDARCRGLPLAEAVAAACRLAGRKVGQVGLAGLCGS